MKLTKGQIARVESLMDADGRITPSRIVTDAKRKTSPLHSLFDWNVKRAAERYWQHRAREILGAVTIMVTTTETTYKAPMMMRDTSMKGEGYRSVMALRNDPESARESLIYTLETAAGHIRRALDLAQPLGLSGEVDHLLAEVVGVQRMVHAKAA